MNKRISDNERRIAVLRRHYAANNEYERQQMRTGEKVSEYQDYIASWYRAVKPLREVTARAADFFAMKMLPGDSEVVTEDAVLKAAVEQIMTWSNFSEKKKLYLTDLSLIGDLFLKANVMPNKVFFEFIPPENVTLIDEDHRGYLTDIRIEQMVEDEITGQLLTYTEVWNKETFAIYRHTAGKGAPISDMGDPIFYGMNMEYGIDFCPVVHIKFKDIGRPDFHGMGCVEDSLDIIDEANRQASIQARNAFRNRQNWLLTSENVDAANFRIDGVKKIENKDFLDDSPTASQQNVTDESDIWEVPAGSELRSLLTGINWAGLQSIIDSTMEELMERMPALRYYAKADTSNISSATLRLALDAALTQAKEAGSSFKNGIVRAVQMGLTMAIFQGLFPSSLGKYENGDFAFDLKAQEAFMDTNTDKAATLKALTDAGIPRATAMKMVGFSDEEIAEADANTNVEAQKKSAETKNTLNALQGILNA